MAAPARVRSTDGVDLWTQAWSLESRGGAGVKRSRTDPIRRPTSPPVRRVSASPSAVPGRAPRQSPPVRPATRPARTREVARRASAKKVRPSAKPRKASRRSLIPLGVVLVALAVLLLTPLLLNVAAMRAEWQVSQLQMREDDLTTERSSLRAKVAALSSTQRIAEQATSLGLAPADPVDYLFMSGYSPLASDGGAAGDSAAAGG